MRAIWTWLELRVPPLLLLMLAGAGMSMLSRLGDRAGVRLAWPGGPVIASMIALIGIAVCAAGVYAFRTHQTTVDPTRPEATRILVTSGIYRLTRNPMYLGFAVVLLGWALLLSHPLAVLGVPAFMLYMNRFQIEPEEQVLREKFGDEFEAYASRVRRWI